MRRERRTLGLGGERRDLTAISALTLIGQTLTTLLAVLFLRDASTSDALILGITWPQLVLAILLGNLGQATAAWLLDAGEVERTPRALHAAALLIAGMMLAAAVAPVLITLWPSIPLGGADRAIVVRAGIVFSTLAAMGVAASVLSGALVARGRLRRLAWFRLAATTVGVALVWPLTTELGAAGAAVAMGFHHLMLLAFLLVDTRSIHPAVTDAPRLSDLFARMRPVWASGGVTKLDVPLERFLAAGLGAGALSAFFLARSALAAGARVLGDGVIGPGFVRLRRARTDRETRMVVRQELRRGVIVGLVASGLLALTGLVGGTIPIVRAHAVLAPAASILVPLSLVAGGAIVGSLAGALLVAMGKTAMLARVSIAAFTIGITFKVAGTYAFGLAGLGVGTSLHYAVVAAGLAVAATRTAHETVTTPVPP